MTAQPLEEPERSRVPHLLDAASGKAIYEEARTAVDLQVKGLAEARNQAGQALGLGMLLGGFRSIGGDPGFLVSLAVMSLLLVSVGLAAFIWLPRGWRWGIVPASEAFEDFGGLSEAEVYCQRAFDLEEDYKANKTPLKRRQRALQGLIVVVVLLVVVLVVTAT